MIISITGTPGTGKTYISKKLVGIDKKNFTYINLNDLIKTEKLYDKYDKTAKTYDVDTKKLKKLDKRFLEYKNNAVAKKIKPQNDSNNTNNKLKIIKPITFKELVEELKKIKSEKIIILDSHLSQFLYSDLCIVVKSDIKELNKRLKLRKYSAQKIKDNIESEIFDVCLEDAKLLKRNIIVLKNG